MRACNRAFVRTVMRAFVRSCVRAFGRSKGNVSRVWNVARQVSFTLLIPHFAVVIQPS